jgi:hypothetical protein
VTSPEIDALKARALAEGLRTDTDAAPPTEEELAAYVAEVEKSYLTEEEQELALQAQADLARGEREARARARALMKVQKRAFKGIYNRTQFIIWAKQSLRRAQIAHEAAEAEAIDRAEQERDGG